MKRLLIVFSCIAIFGATRGMDSYRQEALGNLEDNIKNSYWGLIIREVAMGTLTSGDICKYETPEIRANLRTGKETAPIRKNQTLFQSLLLEIANYHFNDGAYDAAARVRAFLEGLIIRGYVDSNPELLNDQNSDGSKLFGDSSWYGLPTRQDARFEHKNILKSIEENKTRVQEAISSNSMSVLAGDIIKHNVDEQYLTQLSATQKQELSKFLDENLRKKGAVEKDSRLRIMIDNLIGQAPGKPSPTKTSFTFGNGKYMMGAALLVVVGLLAYKHYTSSESEDDEAETEEDIEQQKDTADDGDLNHAK
jgi:hypothetical protein